MLILGMIVSAVTFAAMLGFISLCDRVVNSDVTVPVAERRASCLVRAAGEVLMRM